MCEVSRSVVEKRWRGKGKGGGRESEKGQQRKRDVASSLALCVGKKEPRRSLKPSCAGSRVVNKCALCKLSPRLPATRNFSE